MTYSVRRYQAGSADLRRMTALIQEAWLPERRPDANFHIGDLYWRLREPAYEQALWLWEDVQGEMAAFAEWHPQAAQLEFQTHPRCAGRGLEADILAWAENEAQNAPIGEPSAAAGVNHAPASAAAAQLPLLTTFAAETDTPFLALLAARGYQRQNEYTNYHMRPLAPPDEMAIEAPALPGTRCGLWPARKRSRHGWPDTAPAGSPRK